MAQLGTNTLTQTGGDIRKSGEQLLKIQQEQWITYCALGGLITLESDRPDQTQDIHQMTVTQFSEEIGVPRRTLYNWKAQIHDFAERVRRRRLEVHSLSRETALYNRAYLIAMTSKDHKAAGEMIKMLAGHFSKLDLPIQRQEIENKGESWANLVERKQREVIEGEIVNDPQVHEHDRPTNNT